MAIRISLLGRFEVHAGDTLVLDRSWSRRKAASLLKLLALQTTRSLHREQVMDALWPDLDPAAAANNLHKNLHHLRGALAPHLAPHEAPATLIALTGEVVALAPEVWVDCQAFRQQAEVARAVGNDIALHEAALALYGGPLLPEDVYEDWAQAARDALQLLYVALLGDAGTLYEAQGQPERAIELWRRVLDADSVHETAHRTLMRLYAQAGSRHRALRQYQQCREALQRELGVEPDPATEQVHRAILDGTALPAAGFEAPVATSATARREPLPPFFGRERELELAEELLESVLAGRGQALFVAGAAGIGKSRFAKQVVGVAEEHGAITLEGRSYEVEAASYQPVREMLRQLLTMPAESRPDGGASVRLLESAVHLRRLLPELAAGGSGSMFPTVIDADVLQAELFDEIAGAIGTLAGAGRPLVLYFDDMHAADEASLRLLHVLCRRLAHRPVLVLGTYRAEASDQPPALAALLGSLRRERLCREVTLGPLPAATMRLLVEQHFGGRPVARDLMQEITQRAGGNPLYAGELVHTVIEQGWARVVDGRWQRREAERVPVPAAVHDLVDQRLRRLSQPALHVLHLAAAGHEVAYSLLRRTIDSTEGALLDALDDCLAAYLLEETPRGYHFHHDLLREAVYGRLSQARRHQLHRTLAVVLESEAPGGTEDQAEEIARHFAQSDEPWRAVPYLQQAGRRAAAVFANDQAIRFFEHALAIVREYPDRTEPRAVATLLEELGDLVQRRGDAARSATLFEEACDRFAAAGDESEMVRVRGKAALAYIAAGDVQRASVLMQATLQAVTAQSPELVVSRTYYILAQLHWHTAQYDDALAAAEKAFEAAVATGDAVQRAHAYEVLALACHSLGDWQKGVECELNRHALGVPGFDTDEAFDAHL
jgi:DNA-binding SARP family transcriptional activator